MYILVQNIASS